jgi:thiosulfate dehydrogenase [quinone] large subunit
MNTNCCCNPKNAAPALIRWALGLLMLTGGVSKLQGMGGFVNGYLIPSFEKTFLPGWMIAGYGYALPVVETLLGLLLILGLCRTGTLLLTGLTLVSLAFGQMLIQGHATVANIFIYVLMTATALWMGDEDRWTLGNRCPCRKRGGTESP